MATKDINRLRLDLPVILPGVPDEADACVGRLVGDLEGRSGIDQVHVLPASGGEPAKLCVHYRPDVLSLGRIREIAEAAGARITERFGHILWETVGLSHERRARTVSEFLRRSTGVLEAVATVAGPVRIEFDRSLTAEGVLRQLLDDLGVEAGPSALPETIAAKVVVQEAHDHEHGGLLGENTELTFAVISDRSLIDAARAKADESVCGNACVGPNDDRVPNCQIHDSDLADHTIAPDLSGRRCEFAECGDGTPGAAHGIVLKRMSDAKQE